MEYRTLEIVEKDAVATLWLNRPEKRNALNRELLTELITALSRLSSSGDVRVLIIRGKGKVFSAGADLDFMRDVKDRTLDELKEEAGLFYDCFEGLSNFPCPVICYAQGSAHGGANGLVATADFAYCDDHSFFSFSEVKLGLIPAAVSPFIVPRTGIHKAKQLMLSGEILDAESAVKAGICDAIVPSDRADAFLENMSDSLLQNAPNALAATKKLFTDLQRSTSNQATKDLTTSLIARIRMSPEAEEGIRAFFEKTKPPWMKSP